MPCPLVDYPEVPPSPSETISFCARAHSEHRFPAPSSTPKEGRRKPVLRVLLLLLLNRIYIAHERSKAHSEHRFPAPSSTPKEGCSKPVLGVLSLLLLLLNRFYIAHERSKNTPSIAFRHLPPLQRKDVVNKCLELCRCCR